MNNRTEAKLTDLSGMQKAIEEILKQAWERGRKYGQNEERPQGEWITTGECVELYDEFGKCSVCGKETYEYDHCPHCGVKMRKSQTQKFDDNDTAYGGLASAT